MYFPPPCPQMDGSRYQHANCVLATSTLLIDRSTVGGLRPTPSRLRDITKDTSGGVTYEQAAAAVSTATGGRVVLSPRYRLTRDQVRDYAAAGYSFGISIDCSVTINTAYHTGSYTGGHTVFVSAYRWNSTLSRGEFRIEDPGTTTAGYLWWPVSLVYKAAEARGGGAINILLGSDTEGRTMVAKMTGYVRTQPDALSAKKAAIVLNKSYSVVSTTNGGGWHRDSDGATANGWHKVKVGLLSYGYIRGEALR